MQRNVANDGDARRGLKDRDMFPTKDGKVAARQGTGSRLLPAQRSANVPTSAYTGSPEQQRDDPSSEQDNFWGSQDEEHLSRIEDAWASQRIRGAAAPALATEQDISEGGRSHGARLRSMYRGEAALEEPFAVTDQAEHRASDAQSGSGTDATARNPNKAEGAPTRSDLRKYDGPLPSDLPPPQSQLQSRSANAALFSRVQSGRNLPNAIPEEQEDEEDTSTSWQREAGDTAQDDLRRTHAGRDHDEAMIPSSPVLPAQLQPTLDAFEAGAPWSNPPGTAAERSFFLRRQPSSSPDSQYESAYPHGTQAENLQFAGRSQDPQKAHPAPSSALPPAKRPRLGVGRPHGQSSKPAPPEGQVVNPANATINARAVSAAQRPVCPAPTSLHRSTSASELQRQGPGPDEVVISHAGRGRLNGATLPRAPAITNPKAGRSGLQADEDFDMDDPDLWADEESLRMAEEAAVIQASQAVRASQIQSHLISTSTRPAPSVHGQHMASHQARNGRVLARTESAPAISPSSAEKAPIGPREQRATNANSSLRPLQQPSNVLTTSNVGTSFTMSALESSKRMRQGVPVRQQGVVHPQSRDSTQHIGAEHASDLTSAEERLRHLEDERRKARQVAEGEINILRSRHTKLEKEADLLRKQNAELASRHAEELERIRREREEERIANETQAAFGHIQNATSSRWVAGGSVRRRAPATLLREGSGPNSSAAQRAGLTTPTKRGGRILRNLGSGSRSQDREQEESPKSQRRMHDPLPFPNLDNSFALPKLRHTLHKEQQTAPQSGSHENQESLSSVRSATPTRGTPSRQREVSSLWSDPVARGPWMQASYIKRRAELLGSVLSHTCSQVENAGTDESHSEEADSSPQNRTIQRLLNVRIPQSTRAALKADHAAACSALLALLSSHADATARFAFLAHRTAKDQGNKELEEEDWFCASEALEEGLEEAIEELVKILHAFLNLFWDGGLLNDTLHVLELVTSLSLRHPFIIRALLSAVEEPECDEESQRDAEDMTAEVVNNSQHPGGPSRDLLDTQETPSKGRVPVDRKRRLSFLELLLAYVHLARSTSTRHELRIGTTAQTAPTSALTKKPDIPPTAAADRAELVQSSGAYQAWQVNEAEAESLLSTVTGVLEVMVAVLQTHEYEILRQLFTTTGFLGTLLRSKRSTTVLLRMLRVLTHAIRFSNAWHVILACPLDKNDLAAFHPRVSTSPAPLFELLSVLLKDSETAKRPPSEVHALHQAISLFLSQLVITQPQALPVVAESASLLTALVRQVYEDTALVWHSDDSCASQAHLEPAKLVARMVCTVRLLAMLYLFPERPVNMARKISSDACHAVYNGARHAYILSLSRIAFAEEPEWIEEEQRQEVQRMGDLATELLELVLTPDELDAAWELCADHSDSDENVRLNGDGDAVGDVDMGPAPTQGSETQDEEEEAMQVDEHNTTSASHREHVLATGQDAAQGLGAAPAERSAPTDDRAKLGIHKTTADPQVDRKRSVSTQSQAQQTKETQGHRKAPIVIQLSDSEEER